MTALSNGNYVVSSSAWDNGPSIDAVPRPGEAVLAALPRTQHSQQSRGIDGERPRRRAADAGRPKRNYVVLSRLWDNGTIVNVGCSDLGKRHQRG